MSRERFEAIRDKVVRALPPAKRKGRLNVADLGCGTGTQCEVWAELGHAVHGVDIDAALIAGARQAAAGRYGIEYRTGTACERHWPAGSMDVCLLVELLEHVPRWQACLDECARLLGAGGLVFISTTNRLCPRQQEFDLPLYSWYPPALKRRFEHMAVTTRPELVRGSPYPALHWFSPAELCRELEDRGFSTADRFDMTDTERLNIFAHGLVRLLRAAPPLRFAAHVLTPYTSVLGIKRE